MKRRFCIFIGLFLWFGTMVYSWAEVPPSVGECSSPIYVEKQIPMMGTLVTLRLYAPQGKTQAEMRAIVEGAVACAREVERRFSAFDPDSELSYINDAPHGCVIPISPMMREVLTLALSLAKLSDGAFDPTLGPCIRLWRKAKRTGQLPAADRLCTARAASGWQKLHLSPEGVCKTVPGMRLDLGGIAKGVAVDGMVRYVKSKGIVSYCIDTTSDIALGAAPPGAKGWRVGLPGQGAATLTLSNAMISTSGELHQKVTIQGRSYAHIIDPTTGLGHTSVRQVTVRASSATLADACATAFSLLPENQAELLAKKLGVKIIASSSQMSMKQAD